jgi:hypothetical protein
MAKRAARTGRRVLRAAADELGLTTPKTARRRTPVRIRKTPPTTAPRRPRR